MRSARGCGALHRRADLKSRTRGPKNGTPSPGTTARTKMRTSSVAADEADELALNLDPVRSEHARLIGRIGGFERDRGTTPAQALQGRFFVVDQRHDDVARARHVLS